MDFDIIDKKEDLEGLKEEWNGILERSAKPNVLDSHQWYSCWANAFSGPRRIVILLGREGEKLKGILPLMKHTYRRGHLRFPVLKSMTNRLSSRFDLISDSPSAPLLAELLRKAFKSTWQRVIVLEKVAKDSLVRQHIEEACRQAGLLFFERTVSENWQIRMDVSFQAFFDRLESKFRRNVRAAERKTTGRGAFEVLQPTGLDDLPAYLERGFALQLNGWKGRQGTAITQDESVRSFYRELAAEGYKAGWLRYMLLTSNGDDLSFMYCLAGYGVVHGLEIGMDEQFKGIGPGMVVTKRMLEQVFGENRHETWNFGGGRDRWKKDWCNERELRYDVFVFRKGPIGALLRALVRYYDARHPFVPFDGGAPAEPRMRNMDDYVPTKPEVNNNEKDTERPSTILRNATEHRVVGPLETPGKRERHEPVVSRQ